SANDLDRGTLAPNALKGAIVYIGSPDEVVTTPLGMSTVAAVHAQALENMLLGTVLRRPSAATTAEMVCLALLGLATILLLVRFGALWAGAFTLAAIVAACAASWELYAG